MSTFFTSLLTKLRSSEVRELATEKQACLKELEKWEEILQVIQEMLVEFEQREDRDVKEWLAELQHLAYDMDDILDVFATKSLEREVMQGEQTSASMVQRFVSTSFIMPAALKYFSTQFTAKMKKITHKLQELELTSKWIWKNEILWSMRIIGQMRLPSVSLVDEARVHGREKDKAKILDLLLNNTVDYDGVAVICIVGMAGIGKTTLAKLVYNHFKVHNFFDLKAWVYVSQDFDVTRITKSILEAISSKEHGATDLRMLQVQLKEMLNNKRFLLVLDDVCNERYTELEIFQSPFGTAAPGSKILVTTRSPRVSEIMASTPYQLSKLSYEECLSIFTKSALGTEGFSGYPHLEKIGKNIVEKLDGLPLAAEYVGYSLRGNCEQAAWNKVLEQIQGTSEGSSNCVVAALKSSYNVLPSTLKQCFAYCSIFPKDCEFTKDEIISLWMAEGFLSDAPGGCQMEDLGSRYFEELVSMSFFHASIMDESRFVMHIHINELAQLVAGTTCFRMEGGGRMKEPERLRHLSYDSAMIDEFKNLKSSRNLRTFIPIIRPPPHNTYRCIPKAVLLDLLPKLKFLRVLSLREFSRSQLPDFIGDLRHLRYLDFSQSKIKSLPHSICALYNLKTLLLRQCRNLAKLPSKMGNLINQRHLDITETFSLRGIPIQIGELTNLEILSRFVLAPGNGFHIRAMKNLLHLRGELSISGLENILTAEDALEARLGDKVGLRSLELKWSESVVRNIGVETEVLDALRPDKALEKLTVEGYGGTLFPNWVGDPSLSNVQFLELRHCKRCESMPSIGELSQLKELCIRGCDNLKSEGAEFYGENLSNAFPSLETLCFEDMLEWEDWNPCKVEELTGNFPRLRQLSIISCPKLSGSLPSFLPSLEKLSIISCPELSGSLPSFLPSLEKLVIRGCQELEVSVSAFPVLHELEIVGCKILVHGSVVKSYSLKEVSISNISKLTCLTEKLILGFRSIESLVIDACEELISLWPPNTKQLLHMGSLDVLKISNCPKLVLLEAEEDEEELQQVEVHRLVGHLHLSLMSSERAKKLPKASRIFTSLRELRIEKCPKLVSFSGVCFPLTLKRLVISNCEKLKFFLQDKAKDNINNNYLLEYLEIEHCPSLDGLLPVPPKNQHIDSGSRLASLSSSAKILAGIKQLRISYCAELKSINGELLVGLQRLQVWNCSELTVLSESSMLLKELKRLQIINCPSLTSIKIHGNTSLAYIGVIGCKEIKSLPQGLGKLRHLQEIELVYCPRLSLSSESWLPTTNLKELQIDECEKLQTLPNNFHNLTSLERLEISNCSIPKEGLPISLKKLSISQREKEREKEWKPHELTSLEKLTSLEILIIEGGCPNAVSFPPEELEMKLPPSLVNLTIKDFPELQFLSSTHFEKLTSVKYLSIMDCPKVMYLPKKGNLRSLNRLHIDDCPLLKSRCLTNRLERRKIAHVPYVRIDDKLLGEED